jgi:Zn-dependent protease
MAVTMKIPGHESLLAPIVGILFYALIINFALALFNVLPIPPLDGHWILYGLLPHSSAVLLERWSSYGFILLYALMFLGMFQFIFLPTFWVRRFLAFL